VFKSGSEYCEGLFAADKAGRDIFHATMSLKTLQLDDMHRHHERGGHPAPIKEVFDLFIANCKTNHSPDEYLVINEMLVAFRGRCNSRKKFVWIQDLMSSGLEDILSI
jgi:hypothetical protein